ncbi:MAG: hypothetical protein FJ087_21035 [Deltaproteobacteria bacterium]|nr:hypothetical protein [Deltaproteobacteria bacterium]
MATSGDGSTASGAESAASGDGSITSGTGSRTSGAASGAVSGTPSGGALHAAVIAEVHGARITSADCPYRFALWATQPFRSTTTASYQPAAYPAQIPASSESCTIGVVAPGKASATSPGVAL